MALGIRALLAYRSAKQPRFAVRVNWERVTGSYAKRTQGCLSSAKSPKHSALGVVAAPCFFSLLVLAPFGPQRDLRLESKELRSWRRGPESNRRRKKIL